MSLTRLKLNGLTNNGVNQLGTDSLFTTGEVKYVSSTLGSDGNRGSDPALPKATLAGAQAACSANRNDLVVVMPNHVETVIGAAGIALSKAGVTYLGTASGAMRPTITFTTAVAASLDITAANVSISNLVFTCGIDNQTAMMNINSADVSLSGVEFRTNSGTVGAAKGILTAATAARLSVDSSRFVGPATNSGTTTTAQISHEVGIDYVISNSYFTGKVTQSITNAATILGGLIDSNRFVIATGTKAINMAAASTPFIVNNRINVPSGTAPIVAAAGFVIGNLYSAAAGVTAPTAATF